MRKIAGVAVTLVVAVVIGVAGGLAIAQDEADVTPPTFESARTDSGGENVIITFSEDIGLPAIVTVIADQHDITLHTFYRAVTTVTIDGEVNLALWASLSGNELTLRLETPTVGAGQEVTVSYDNIFARDAPGLFVDGAGNPLATFGPQTVDNQAWVPAKSATPGPVISPAEITIDEGSSATIDVSLPSQPDGDVTVSVFSAVAAVEVSPGTLTFTADNWDEGQDVTVTAPEDGNAYNSWDLVIASIDGQSTASTYSVFTRVVVEDQDEER